MKRTVAMDARKSQSQASSRSKKKRALGGLGGVKAEFKKISWTSKEELKAYTKIVAIATFSVGIGIFVVDLLVRGALSAVGTLLRAIVG